MVNLLGGGMIKSLLFILLISYNLFSMTIEPSASLSPRWYNLQELPIERDQSLPSVLKQIDISSLPNLAPTGNLEDFKLALKRQIDRCKNQDPETIWIFENKRIPRKTWCLKTSQAFLELANQSKTTSHLWEKAKQLFNWYKSSGNNGTGNVLYTGYFLPTLYGTRLPDSINKYPLYKRPKDLVRVKIAGQYLWKKLNPDGSYSKYLTRHDIDWNYGLDNKNLEIAYVDDPVAAFFLHIQGSGIVHLKNSSERILVNYAAQNGHPYVAIGKVLKNEGVDKYYYSSLQGLDEYFTENPHEIDRVFPKNPSYVFFQEASTGPYGANGTVLVPGQAIAIDSTKYPYGALALIKTQQPIITDNEIVNWIDFTRLMTTQDTGGAIKGAGRVDIYWGSGEYAALAAGYQNHEGELFFAVHPNL